MSTSPTTRSRRALAAALVTGIALSGVGVIGTGTASAEGTGAKFGAAKTACLAGIDRRATALDRLSGRIASDTSLTDGHRSTLDGIVSNARSAMSTLRPQVEADADAASLRTHCESVVKDYRVFALVAPQVHITRGADAASAAVSRLADAESKISDAIATAKAAGKDTAQAEADAATFSAAIDKVESDVSGLADSVLAITPADYNADSHVLDAPRAQGRTVREDAKAVRTAGTAVRASLKALRG